MANNVCLSRECGKNTQFWTLLALGGLVMLGTLSAFFFLEHHGHNETGMNNQIVWGLPHVFAVFLIVAASSKIHTLQPIRPVPLTLGAAGMPCEPLTAKRAANTALASMPESSLG